MTREKRDEKLFDEIAHRYAHKDIVPSSSLARGDQILAAVRPILESCPRIDTIVDIGCGAGAAARYLNGHYKRYIGIDQSEQMIRAAISFNSDNPRVEFISGNIKRQDLPQNVADVVLSIGALHHITELDDALESVKGMAKSDAFFVAIEPQSGNPLLQALRRLRAMVDSSYSAEQMYFSESGLHDLLARHGLTDIRIEYQGFLATPFAQVVFYPQAIFKPLCRLAVRADRWLERSLPRFLKKLSFNIVVRGIIRK